MALRQQQLESQAWFQLQHYQYYYSRYRCTDLGSVKAFEVDAEYVFLVGVH